jgi:hypothetical protein
VNDRSWDFVKERKVTVMIMHFILHDERPNLDPANNAVVLDWERVYRKICEKSYNAGASRSLWVAVLLLIVVVSNGVALHCRNEAVSQDYQ